MRKILKCPGPNLQIKSSKPHQNTCRVSAVPFPRLLWSFLTLADSQLICSWHSLLKNRESTLFSWFLGTIWNYVSAMWCIWKGSAMSIYGNIVDQSWNEEIELQIWQNTNAKETKWKGKKKGNRNIKDRKPEMKERKFKSDRKDRKYQVIHYLNLLIIISTLQVKKYYHFRTF